MRSGEIKNAYLKIDDTAPSQDSRNAQVLILNQHGGSPDFRYFDGNEVQRDFTEAEAAARENGGEAAVDSYRAAVQAYLRLEQDAGVTEITDIVRQHLMDAHIHAITASVIPPRGLLDTNRLIDELSIPVEVSDAARKRLMAIHHGLTASLLELVKETPDALVLDLHSMAAANPLPYDKPVLRDPESLSNYVRNWNGGTHEAALRPTSAITMADGAMVGNIEFANRLINNWGATGNRVELNEVFSLRQDIHTGARAMAGGRGAVLDMSKAHLTRTAPVQIDHANLLVDPERASAISDLIAHAIQQTLKLRSRT